MKKAIEWLKNLALILLFLLMTGTIIFLYIDAKNNKDYIVKELNDIKTAMIDDKLMQKQGFVKIENDILSAYDIINQRDKEFQSQLKNINVNIRNLKNYTKIDFSSTEEKVVPLLPSPDIKNGLNKWLFNSAGNNFSVSGNVDLSKKTVSIKQTYTANVSLINSYKNRFVFRDKAYLTLMSNDENIKLKVNSFTVKERKTVFDLSVFAGIDILSRQPTIGIGLSKSIISFKSKK